ncbi:MAG: hypothetical protein M1814_006406 [Vezdaea aestivalis]|nr:MAG: hypothetical protein M1814_006406 [Vezdaea aestivalis]
MATELSTTAVNGNYNGPPPHEIVDPNIAGYPAGNVDTFGSQPASMETSNEEQGPSKDEVGWSFVKQYYKSLHSHPEKLHLFYNKKSQFVSGIEAEKVNISVGRSAIADRFKTLDFEDCKVLLTNVDIQSSDSNILLQVIGAMSNKGEPHNKFIQTFILTRQSVGYYVLNDMLRFIQDEADDAEVADNAVEVGTEKEITTKPANIPTDPVEVDAVNSEEVPAVEDAPVDSGVPKEEEEPLKSGASEPQTVNGLNNGPEAEIVEAEDAPVAAVTPSHPRATSEESPSSDSEPPSTSKSAKVSSPQAELAHKAEAPRAEKPAEVKPQVPKTWANLVAASDSKPASRAPATIVPAATPAPTRASASATAAAAAPTPPGEAAPAAPAAGPQPASGWQTAGQEHAKRQSRPQSMSGDRPNTSAYIKYVTEKVEEKELRSALEAFGELAYFDISRPKNCAFAEFATVTGYNAAIAANPHRVNGESIVVEERRPRANAYGGSAYNPNRNGPNRGRGSFDARAGGQNGRGGFQRDGGRGGGNYGQGRGRGGNSTPRGRGGGQTA